MATLAPRPGPAIIQRANSLQASDTSHTSGSTADTSVSHANSKPSPVSSIGESISSVVHKPVAVHIPAARPARPLPVPPQPAPAPTSASTSTLKLSNQDSHSTLGKSSGPASKTTPGATQALTKSKTTPPRKLLRTRSEALERTPAPPPSSYAPRRISDDEPWVSISVMPAVAERPPHVDADERLPVSAQDLDTRAQASYAKPTAASSNKRAKSKRSASTAPVNHTAKITPVSKSLPRLPADPPQPEPEPQPQHPPQGNDAAWKLEFRGMVRLVRWVSRGGKRAPLETENANENEADRERDNEKLVIEEKENVGARKGFSITSEARRSRDSYNQPRPIVNGTGAAVSVAQPRARPLSLARPRPKLEDGVNAREREQEREREREKEGNKRRLTKSNPGLVNFVLPDTRTSTDASRISNDSRPDAKRLRTSTDAALKDVPEMPLGPAKGMNSFPNRTSSLSPTHAASSSHPPLPSSFFRPPSFLVGSSSQPAASSLSTTTAPVGIDSVRPYSAESTALAYLQPEPMSATATETALGVPLAAGPSQSHGFMPFSPSGTTSALSPVSEVPIFTSGLVASPPELAADINEFPWAATRPPRSKIVVGEVVPTGFGASTGGKMDAGTSSIVTGVLGNAPAAASGGLLSPLSNSMSPLSPLSSSASPLMSNVVSPMSSSSSPLMPSDANLSDSYVLSHIPGTTASSLSYATARSSRNSITAQAVWDSRAQAVPVPDRSSYERKRTSTEITYRTSTDHAFLRGTATDIGHGCSTRAASPTPSDRYAFSEDGHAPAGILRTLSTLDHSNTPLTAPRRPFMHARGSSGSVTFEDSSAQSSPKIGGRRKMMTMSASDIGHGSSGMGVMGGSSLAIGGTRYGYGRPGPAVVHRSKSSLSIAGRIIRTLSISSRNKPEEQEDETVRPRVTRKLTRRKPGAVSQGGSRASSTVSLVYGEGDGVPPVPPLPPGILAGRYSRGGSEVGHGAMGSESALGHGGRESAMGYARGESVNGHSAWGGSTSHIGHESVNDHTLVSPAPTRLSFATTQSAPAGLNGGRKLVKKRPSQSRRADMLADLPPRTLASLDLTNESVSKEAPRITTEFVQVPLLPDGHPLTVTAAGTEDGHLMAIRPGLPRRTSSQRRWTIADMDDDEFLRQLEAKLSGSGSRLRKSRVLEEFAMGADQGRDTEADEDPGSQTDDSAAEREWVKARRAMMCVREIVRTEKSYLRHLSSVANDASISSILVDHLPRLMETSRAFSTRLEEDPSAWGVSVAFLGVEEQLESALVEWSGVVGKVISSLQNKGDSQAASEDGHTSSAGSTASSWIRRRSATASASVQPFQLNLTMTPVNSGSKDKKSARVTKTRRLTEQDVVIMPTQRVLRYVLMYRELLLHTPVTSASRPLVERALQGATRIARRCDEAQTHVDILSPI